MEDKDLGQWKLIPIILGTALAKFAPPEKWCILEEPLAYEVMDLFLIVQDKSHHHSTYTSDALENWCPSTKCMKHNAIALYRHMMASTKSVCSNSFVKKGGKDIMNIAYG